MWNRTHVKKAIMTIPYNSTKGSMRKYVTDGMIILNYENNKIIWYTDNERNTTNIVNNKDISLLIDSLMYII